MSQVVKNNRGFLQLLAVYPAHHRKRKQNYKSRSIICRSRRLRQIVDLRDTDKSRYFAITLFNNCFIIRTPSLFFLMNILGKRSDLPFTRKSDLKKEKSTVSFTHEQNIICSQTLLDGIAHEQTIICRQLFAGHVVGSRPMKREKNLLRMIISLILPLSLRGVTTSLTMIFYLQSRRAIECKDQLLINKAILEEATSKNKNLSTAWIDYKKAFDGVPHSWVKKCHEIYRICPTTIKFV